MPKKISLPDFLSFNNQSLSYGTATHKAISHSLQLDKQVLALGIVQCFYEINNIKSFSLEFKEERIKTVENNSFFEPPQLFRLYSTNVSSICYVNDNLNENDLANIKIIQDKLSSFENYVSYETTEKVLYWILENSYLNNMPYSYQDKSTDKNNFIFSIDKHFAHLLCESCYGENYTALTNEILKKYVVGVPENTTKRNKI